MRMSVMVPMRIVASGEIAVGASEVQGPNIRCKMAYIKANKANSGQVYVGYATGVTVADAGTDTTTGLELDAGQDTPMMVVGNLNQLFFIGSGAGQAITYLLADSN